MTSVIIRNLIGGFIMHNIENFISSFLNLSLSDIESVNLTSDVAEPINSQVKLVLYNSKGIHISERRRKRIMYSINKSGFLLR